MKVLIIEDDLSTAELLRLRLEALSCRVVAARTADEGLAMATAERPELIVCDLKLSHDLADGARVIRTLRERAETAMIPLVVHSIYVTHPTELPRGLPAADGYLPKPFRFEQLRRLVEGLRGSGRPTRAAQAALLPATGAAAAGTPAATVPVAHQKGCWYPEPLGRQPPP